MERLALRGGNMGVKYVKVPVSKLAELLNRDRELEHLEANGVDNWCGYEFEDDFYEEYLSEEDVLRMFEEVE